MFQNHFLPWGGVGWEGSPSSCSLCIHGDFSFSHRALVYPLQKRDLTPLSWLVGFWCFKECGKVAVIVPLLALALFLVIATLCSCQTRPPFAIYLALLGLKEISLKKKKST